MIRSFADREAEALFAGRLARRLPRDIQRAAQRKLRQLHEAEELRDLAAPPGNRLEALRGSRAGQHSIRINDQWRLCFVWKDGGAERVEIVDYHQG
jgi:proteic killer suppression protein